MNNDYFDNQSDEETNPDFSLAVERYKKACEEGGEQDASFSEEEFEYIIEYFIGENNEDAVLKAAEIAFYKHSYSSALLVKFCDALIVSGDSDRAIELLKEYEESFHNNPDIFLLFTRAYVRKRLYPGARDYLAMALAQDFKAEEIVDSICSIGQDCIDMGSYQEALYYFDKAAALSPINYEYYNDCAFCYDKLDDVSKALEYYNKYLDADPFNDYVWFNVGTVYARLKEFEKAVEAFEYSLALNGKNDSSLYNLAVVFLNLDRYQEALNYFRQCYEEDEHSAASCLGMADSYLGLRDLEQAKHYFMQALLADENCEDARLGYDCVLAIEQYMRGERLSFIEQMRVIAKQDSTWINTVYSILPQLSTDGDFVNLLLQSRRPGNYLN